MILDDNTVIPSYLQADEYEPDEDTGKLTNLALRMGEVKEVVYPDDPRSIGKRQVEYSVRVQHRDAYGPIVSSMYRGCTVANLFGGIADGFNYTLRADDKSQNRSDGIGNGSKVLLLCVNGSTASPLIIGGVQDPVFDSVIESKELGHHLDFSFNGFKAGVDKDGQGWLEFNGSTDWEAATQNKKGPSKLLFSADGRVTITSQGVTIGEGTDKMLLASTYRKAENNLHQQLESQLQTLQNQLSQVATGLLTVGSLHSVPISGPVAGASILQTCGKTLLKAVSTLGKMESALKEFEKSSDSYLSKKNLND